jgi:hypothetical protein
MKNLPDYGKISFDDFEGMKFEDIVPEASPDAIDLLKKFLVYPSKQRISAQQVVFFYSFFRLYLFRFYFKGIITFLFLYITITLSSYGFTNTS